MEKDMSSVTNISQRQLNKQYAKVTSKIRAAGYYAPELDSDARLNKIHSIIVAEGLPMEFYANYDYQQVAKPDAPDVKYFQSRSSQAKINDRAEANYQKFIGRGEKLYRPPIMLQHGDFIVPIVGHGRTSFFRLVIEKRETYPSPAIIVNCDSMGYLAFLLFGSKLAGISNEEDPHTPQIDNSADIGKQLRDHLELCERDPNHAIHSFDREQLFQFCDNWLKTAKYACEGDDTASRRVRTNIINMELKIDRAYALPFPDDEDVDEQWLLHFGTPFNRHIQKNVLKSGRNTTQYIDWVKKMYNHWVDDPIGSQKKVWAIIRPGTTMDAGTKVSTTINACDKWLEDAHKWNTNPRHVYDAKFPILDKFLLVPAIDDPADRGYAAYEWNYDTEEFVKKQKTS